MRKNEFVTSGELEAFWQKIFLKLYWKYSTGARLPWVEKEVRFLNIGEERGGQKGPLQFIDNSETSCIKAVHFGSSHNSRDMEWLDKETFHLYVEEATKPYFSSQSGDSIDIKYDISQLKIGGHFICS